jgi:uncharacterized membrane protein
VSERYLATVALHILAAVVWLGGMLFFAIAAPVLRRLEDERGRAELFDALGRRFRVVGWACVTLLVATGIEQLRARGWWGWALWTGTGVWRTALGWKLALAALMVVVQAVHDFWLGPRAGRAVPGTPEARSLRRSAAWLARLNALAGLVLVYVAVRLARGG